MDDIQSSDIVAIEISARFTAGQLGRFLKAPAREALLGSSKTRILREPWESD